MTPVVVPEDQRAGVAVLRGALRHVTPEKAETTAYKLVTPTGEEFELPESVCLLLRQIIEILDRGDAITVVPVGKELTTQQAANILNVSHQYVVRLLDGGHIPFSRTEPHRIRMEDLLAYKRQRDRHRLISLDALTRLSQDAGGYDEIGRLTALDGAGDPVTQ